MNVMYAYHANPGDIKIKKNRPTFCFAWSAQSLVMTNKDKKSNHIKEKVL